MVTILQKLFFLATDNTNKFARVFFPVEALQAHLTFASNAALEYKVGRLLTLPANISLGRDQPSSFLDGEKSFEESGPVDNQN
jgi:hypothetical protein